MPVGTRPTSMLPPEPEQYEPRRASVNAPSADIEVFERAFADAAARQPARTDSAQRVSGLRSLIVDAAGAMVAAVAAWYEPRCPACGAQGTVSIELRGCTEDSTGRLRERCRACEESWASVRCEDYSGWC